LHPGALNQIPEICILGCARLMGGIFPGKVTRYNAKEKSTDADETCKRCISLSKEMVLVHCLSLLDLWMRTFCEFLSRDGNVETISEARSINPGLLPVAFILRESVSFGARDFTNGTYNF
jgi:hypothetical protein